MKVIDAMQKITNGEEFRFKILSEDRTYHVYKDSQVFDEENEDYVQWFIDYDWLNEEVEIIEEKKKPMKIYWNVDDDTYTTTVGHKDYKVNKDDFEELSNMYRQKINEIIDVLNEMREDR